MATNDVNFTPLHSAASNGHQTVVELLLKKGATVDAKDEGGLTSLHYASHNGHFEYVELLIQYRANVNATDYNGISALQRPYATGNLKVLSLLINCGAEVNHKDNEGVTPLLSAILYKEQKKVVEQLLMVGADRTMVNNLGWSALDIALQSGYLEIAVFFENTFERVLLY